MADPARHRTDADVEAIQGSGDRRSGEAVTWFIVRTENEVRIYSELRPKLPTPKRTPADARVIRERMAIALALLKGGVA